MQYRTRCNSSLALLLVIDDDVHDMTPQLQHSPGLKNPRLEKSWKDTRRGETRLETPKCMSLLSYGSSSATRQTIARSAQLRCTGTWIRPD